MSFPSSFGPQVAAIMDVLAKAAVAEITKLVEDGTVVLRLEMRRRDSEIQELKRSLNAMEAELCKAQEAATTRATEEHQEKPTNRIQVSPKGEKDTQEQYSTMYLEQRTDDSLQPEVEQNHNTGPVVKREPGDEHAAQERTDDADADPIWSLPACSLFERSSVPAQQDTQTFPSHEEQFCRLSAESSFNSSSTEIEETAGGVPIKVEVEIQPLCVESTSSESVRDEHLRHVSCPSVSQEQSSQPALQRAGPSLALPPEQRSTAETQDPILSRNSVRAKRLMNVWRTNQKLFVCSVCNKGFLRMSQLEEHKSTHQPFKPFRCLECGKSFTQKTRLKTHQSVHTGERPFSCKICGKMFSRQDNCLRHERFHSGLKPYSCGRCGKSFTVLGNLRIHQEIHLQGR